MKMKPIFLILSVCFSLAFGLTVLASAASADNETTPPAVKGEATPAAAGAPDTKTAEALKIHEPFIRQAFDLAILSAKKGNHPFGALLVYQGNVILTAENAVITDNDPSRHAELNLLLQARRKISREVLRESTLYVSTSPCMACCAAMWYSNVSKIVYGVSQEAFEKATGYHDGIRCDQLYRETDKKLEWTGPILEEEGLKVFGKN